MYLKPTNSFTYVIPSTCYPRKNIENVPVGVALCLQKNIRNTVSDKGQQQFSQISNKIPREEARRRKNKGDYKAFPLIKEVNPILTDLNSVTEEHFRHEGKFPRKAGKSTAQKK